MIVLTEIALSSSSAQDLVIETAAAIANIWGLTVCPVLENGNLIIDRLLHFNLPSGSPGLWLGTLPPQEQYNAVYQLAQQNGICLLNTPEQHRQLRRDRFLTPPLRHCQSHNGLPYGREYRVFLYQQTVLTYAYHRQEDDPLAFVEIDEEVEMLTVAINAAHQISAPLVAIDVGQLEDHQWLVTGLHDPQFSLNAQTPIIQLWSQLVDLVNR